MSRPRSLRSGLAAFVVVAGGVCALLAACSDGSDGAAAADSGLVDTAPGDASARDGRDTGVGANSARITFVNAAHDLGPNAKIGPTAALRVCFKIGSVAENLTVAPIPPLPDRVLAGAPTLPSGMSLPGIFYGTGATLPNVGLDYAGRIIVPILISSKSLSVRGVDDVSPGQRAAGCDELVGDNADAAAGLSELTDYWVLPAIAPGTLQNGKAYVVALTGCVADATTPNPGKCGVGFVGTGDPGLGNLQLRIYETNQASVAPFGAQFLYLSTQANAFFSQATLKDAIHPGFVTSTVDGSGFRPITGVSPPITALSEVVSVANVTDNDAFVFGPKSNPSSDAGSPPLLPSSLADIQERSGLPSSGAGTVYQNGRSYVFIALGDPDTGETKQFIKPDGNPGGDGGDGSRANTRFFHFLAFPTNPTVEPYTAP